MDKALNHLPLFPLSWSRLEKVRFRVLQGLITLKLRSKKACQILKLARQSYEYVSPQVTSKSSNSVRFRCGPISDPSAPVVGIASAGAAGRKSHQTLSRTAESKMHNRAGTWTKLDTFLAKIEEIMSDTVTGTSVSICQPTGDQKFPFSQVQMDNSPVGSCGRNCQEAASAGRKTQTC